MVARRQEGMREWSTCRDSIFERPINKSEGAQVGVMEMDDVVGEEAIGAVTLTRSL